MMHPLGKNGIDLKDPGDYLVYIANMGPIGSKIYL